MKKSAHQIWKDAQKQNLDAQQFKDLLKEEGVIVPKTSLDRQNEIAESIQKRLKTKN